MWSTFLNRKQHQSLSKSETNRTDRLTPRKLIGALHTLSNLPEAREQIGSSDSMPHRQRSLSEAFVLAKQTESPPVVEGLE